MISYAQNFEDIMLWRAFKDLSQGFYIDVGAADPEEFSVTRLFYDAGWRGINIEPSSHYFPRLLSARKHDINLNVAVGEHPGLVTFFEIPDTGLSTLDCDVVAAHRVARFTINEKTVEQLRLADICSQYAPTDIHFLKIDVEGSEANVLRGADFNSFRPWITLVEATKPMTQEENYADWEPILTSAGYRFAWFDGLNRFYVAEERWEALSHHFRVPVNVFDGFNRAADLLKEVEMSNNEAEEAASRAATTIAAAENEVEQARGRASAAELEASKQAALARWAEHELVYAKRESEDARRQAREGAEAAATRAADIRSMRVLLDQMRGSTSWRLTAPIRASRQFLRGHFGVALMELGMTTARAERLRSVAGSHGNIAKRGSRIAFYISARAAGRFPGAPRVAALLERLAQGPWEWLRKHDSAYLAAAGIASSTLADKHVTVPSLPTRHVSKLPTWRVHQFHSGSATGDAITNSMFLIQSELRRLGYESEIFVEHRDPRLADKLLELGDLPEHDKYVLIVHHSMGHDACGRISRLPVQKILIYHNITPTEFLNDVPEILPYAALGRRQLTFLRSHVVASLGDSEINALELREYGYITPEVCPLLFDIDALIITAEKASRSKRQDIFTILFVGRIVASKGQADLIDAFAEFRQLYAAPSRLVLVGKMVSSDAPYSLEIRRRIDAHGLKNDVLVTGPVSDTELHEWYSAADLYVSLSFHEGFGVPLVEAMAHRVPVIAWPAGAVPYTLGGVDELLTSRSPDIVASAMLRFARESQLREQIVTRQQQALNRFRLNHHVPTLLRALAAARAGAPRQEATRATYARNLHFTIVGHINGSYSLAAINRSLALALEESHPNAVRIQAWENGPVDSLNVKSPTELAPVIEKLVSRPSHLVGPNITISHHYPVLVPSQRGDLTVALFFWEESLIPEDTVRVLNGGFDAVFAPSVAVAKALLDSGVSIPVHMVGQAPNLSAFSKIASNRVSGSYQDSQKFTFLHISSCFPRKGVDVLLAAYAKAFRRHDPVRLVIKGFPNPHNDVPEQIERLRQSDTEIGEITMLNEDLNEKAVHELYSEADALVLPTRGEGFNLPAAEAMAAGIPLIVTGYGGHLDFCTAADARLVDFRFAVSRSHVAAAGSLWVEPDVEDLAAALREVFDDITNDQGETAARAAHARAALETRLNPKRWAHRISDASATLLTAPPMSPLHVAWISTWGVRCGIAEYSHFLLDHFVRAETTEQVSTVILCDDRTENVSDDLGLRILPSWRVGDPAQMERLARSISVADPDAIVVQHQPGLFSWRALAELLSDRRVRQRITVVTLHTPQHLMDIELEEREAAIDALGSASRVLVHQISDLELLRKLGLVANVTLFPHGAMVPREMPMIRQLSAEASAIIGCHGFFLPGKGIRRLIEAFACLSGDWPKLRLRLVNAEYPNPHSATEIAECKELAASLGLEERIEWHTSFLSLQECQRLLAQCDLVVLPYDPSRESASGALRVALSSGTPVAVTPVEIFDEMGEAVHRFSTLNVGSIADGINMLLSDPKARRLHQEAASAWLKEREWEPLARRLKGMLTGLCASRRLLN